MIRGTLDEFSLPEIIRLIARGSRSGTLEIRGAEGSGRIVFKDGLVCGAESDLPREPLGRKLIRAGAVREEQLWSALKRPATASNRLGQALVAAGLVSEDQVAAALGEQAEEDVVNVVRLDPLEFVWTSGDPSEAGARLRVEDLIEAISERLREIESVRDRIPLGAAVTLAAVPPQTGAAISVAPSDWTILAMLGARRAVRDLLRYSGGGDVQTLRAIDRLVSEGLVEIIPPESEVQGAREWATPRIEVWEETPRAPEPPPPRPAERIIRLDDDDDAAHAQARVAPFEIAIIGAASRAFNALTEVCLRGGLGGLPVELTSYGIQEMPVVPPAPEVIELAAELGVEISEHQTHRLAEGQLRGVDLVLGLDRFDLDNAITIGGAARDHSFTLQEFATWAERVQTPEDSELPVRARIVVARANRGRSETIDDRKVADARSFYGNSEKALAGHIRTLCRTVVAVLRGGRRLDRSETPPPPPARRGSNQIG